jgi:exosome complex exonuclease DIS3/RRP44
VIVLQTTLEELRHRSLAIYNRVRALISEPDKKFYVFSNEHHRQTFVRKDRKESPNDRNDRAIRTAVKWYEGHAPSPLSVVLVTDDAENRRLAKAGGLKALSGKSSTRILSIITHREIVQFGNTSKSSRISPS